MRRLILCSSLVALIATPAHAERLTRGVTGVSTISGGIEGGSDIAFHWDPSVAEGNVAISKAVLRFTLAGQPVDGALAARVYPITSPWNEGAPSVTYDHDLWSRVELDLRGEGTVAIDVTNLVKEVVEEGQPYYGFVIARGPGEENGLSQAETARLAGLSSATMDVTWRLVPDRPVGVQQGRALLGRHRTNSASVSRISPRLGATRGDGQGRQ